MTKSRRGRPNKYTPQQLKQIATLSAQGLNTREIAEAMEENTNAIKCLMFRRGLHANPRPRKRA